MSNRITSLVKAYLDYKHHLGFQMTAESSFLNAFARYTRDIGYTGALTRRIVFEWCESGDNPSLVTKGRRFEPLKGLADYAAAFDPDSELLPHLPYGNPHKRIRPHIYTLDETCRLIDQCDHLYSPDGIRILTMKTAIGLLWATGLRTSELVNLNVQDVDLLEDLLNICSSKFNKDRIVPLPPDVADNLKSYRKQAEQLCGSARPAGKFFITTGGRALDRRAFEYAFQKIRDIIDVSDSGYSHARLYDFRHTFATRTLRNWLEQGADVNAKLFLLSTYMGHTHPEDTYWYLSSTPELMALASHRYETAYGGAAHE